MVFFWIGTIFDVGVLQEKQTWNLIQFLADAQRNKSVVMPMEDRNIACVSPIESTLRFIFVSMPGMCA